MCRVISAFSYSSQLQCDTFYPRVSPFFILLKINQPVPDFFITPTPFTSSPTSFHFIRYIKHTLLVSHNERGLWSPTLRLTQNLSEKTHRISGKLGKYEETSLEYVVKVRNSRSLWSTLCDRVECSNCCGVPGCCAHPFHPKIQTRCSRETCVTHILSNLTYKLVVVVKPGG